MSHTNSPNNGPSTNWHGVTRLFVKFTPTDPQQPIPVDLVIGFLQAGLNELFWHAKIPGTLEISHIGGEIFIVGDGGEAVKG